MRMVGLQHRLQHSKDSRTQAHVKMGSRVYPACSFSMLLQMLGLLYPLYCVPVPVLEHD